VPAIQSGPQLHSFGRTISPLRPVTLDFSTQIVGAINAQPLVPLVSAVATPVVVVTVPAPMSVAQAPQPVSESAPSLGSTADPGSKTDSDLLPAFALAPRPQPDAPAPPPFGI
jgi:hypothetical protein